MRLHLLWVLAIMTCNVCLDLIERFGTAESVLPWYCKCKLFEHKVVRTKQKLITHQCNCPVVFLKRTKRLIVRCRC